MSRAYLTVPEAAAQLNCCPETIYRAVRNGELKHKKVGKRTIRIKPEDLEAFTDKAVLLALPEKE